jgi:hypothetical protein
VGRDSLAPLSDIGLPVLVEPPKPPEPPKEEPVVRKPDGRGGHR